MRCWLVHVGVLGLLSNSIASAQQVTVTAPATTVSESFSERIGVGFGINHPNFRFGFGGPGGFGAGGFSQPVDGLTVGIPLRGGNVNGNLSITAGQRFSRSLTTTAPMITLTNGVPGSVFSGTVEPFITGLHPVVGAGVPSYAPPAVSRVRSMLDRGDIQLQKEPNGNTRLIINEPPPRRARTEPDSEPSRTNSDSSDSFRRAIEKYTGSKR